MKLFFAISMLILTSCKSETEKPLDKLDWLIGNWESKPADKQILEKWTKLNDSTLLGQSLFVKGSDTLLGEKMQIFSIGETLVFRTEVTDQNEGATIEFVMDSISDTRVYFRNDNHDFPQQIVYTHPTEKSILAYIDGNLNGQYERVDFKLSRSK
jgi:hypothetical protein